MLPFLKQRGQPQDPNPPPPITPALKVNETCAGLQLEDWDSLVPETNNSSHYSEVTRSAEQYVPEDGPSVCCPLQLKLTGSQRGGLDLQLQLIHLRFGDVWEPKARQQWAQKSNAVWWRWLSSSHVDVANKALALCMLRLVLPDSMPHLVKYMAAMGGLSACARLADRAQQWFRQLEEHRQTAAALQLPAITAQRDTNGPQTNGAVQDTLLILSDQSAAVDRVGDWAEAAAATALSLWLGGVIWRTCHPSSFHLLECISALVPVAAGYAHTARAAATGAIPGGAQLEAAWRNRHKTTAQRVSHLMMDSYISPPLAPLMDLLEGVSIRAGLAVEGRGLDGSFRGTDDTTWTAPSITGSHTNGLAASLSWQVGGGPDPLDASNPSNSHHPHQGGHHPHNSNGIPLDDDEVDLPAVSIARDGDWSTEWSELQQKMALEDKVVKQEQQDFQQWHSAIGCCNEHVDDSSSISREEDCSTSEINPDFPIFVSQPRDATAGAASHVSRVSHVSCTSDPSPHPLPASSVLLQQPVGPAAASPSWPQLTETGLTASPESPEAAGSWMSLLASDDLGDSIERIAPLFGQSDHAAVPLPLTAYQKVELAGRACFLLLVFLPFLLFGSIFLMLARALDTPAQQLTQVQITTTDTQRPVARTHVIADQGTSYQDWASVLRKWAFKLLLVGCKGSGAAFIKWGQWAATREDIFPRDFCSIMSALHDRAPTHSYLFSKKEVEAALGRPLSDTFSVFEKASLASGSIAQVHLARVIGAPENEWLAVKVRHPNVARQIWMDFQIMRIVAGLLERHKSLKGLGVKESVSQFSHTMTAQADLRVEAAHLERFYSMI